jgi:FlgN protein
MPTNSLTELLSVLAEKADLLEAMRGALEEEQRCIIGGRPDKLDENTTRASEYVSALTFVNSRFRTLLLRSGEERGIPEIESLSSLMRAVDPDSRLRLKALQDRCFSAAEAVGRLIGMNEGLIRNSLDIIGRSISLFSRLLSGCETYGAGGRILYGKAQSGMLCREV